MKTTPEMLDVALKMCEVHISEKEMVRKTLISTREQLLRQLTACNPLSIEFIRIAKEIRLNELKIKENETNI